MSRIMIPTVNQTRSRNLPVSQLILHVTDLTASCHCLPVTHQVELTAIINLAMEALWRKWHRVLSTILSTILVALTLLLIVLVLVVVVLLIIVLIVARCLFPNVKPEIASNVACLMFNARSLCNKLVELHYLLYSSKFDILLVTESWLHAGITNGLLDPERKFAVLRHDRSITTGGGVCAFGGNSLQVVPVNLDNKYSILELLCFDLVTNNSSSPIRFFLFTGHRASPTMLIYVY